MNLTLDTVAKIKPEAPTERDLTAATRLEPGDYEVYSEKLTATCEEGKEVLVRTGISSMIHAGDLVVGIYTPQGDLVTASCGTFLHAVTGQVPVKFIMENWLPDPTVGVREGDVFYCNEALFGGIHNPDMFALMPVFHHGELIAWAVSGADSAETGAIEPGGRTVRARSRSDEGMRLTPIKIGADYRLREDILLMMANMVTRAPRMMMIDARARASACDHVRRRLQEVAAERGSDFLRGLFRRMIDTAEAGTRKRIAGWKDGIFRGVWFLDSIGYKPALQRAFLTTTKSGDEIVFDFAGTSPENDGSFNSYLHCAIAHAATYLYGWAFRDFPVCSGTLAPLTFLAPKGCFLNANDDAAVSNSILACTAVMNLVHVTMSKLLFESELREVCTAPPYCGSSGNIFAATNQWGVKVADVCGHPLNAHGWGAMPDGDGADAAGFPWAPWGKAPDAEDVETEMPWLHLWQRHLRDSCGHGKFRGGAGTSSAFVVHHVPSMVFLSTTKGAKITAGMGLFGGYPTLSHPGVTALDTGLHEAMARGDRDVPEDVYQLVERRARWGKVLIENSIRPSRVMHRGDIFVVTTYGGGGYGDVLEREPERVAEDVRSDIISLDVARSVYKVVLDPDTLALDLAATDELRRAERRKRLADGKPYAEFEAEWLQLRPADELLEYYGTWPDAKPNRSIVRI